MRLLFTLRHDPDLPVAGRTVERHAVKAIVTHGDELLMLHVPATGEYKFPGGGVHASETPADALARELREECGATLLTVTGAYGQVIELSRPQEPEYERFRMTSVYYTCRVADGRGEQTLDPYEAALGLTPCWVTLEDALLACQQAEQSSAARWVQRERRVLQDLQAHWPQVRSC